MSLSKIEVSIDIGDHFEVVIVFLDNEETKRICNEINKFWSNSHIRLSEANDCIFKCVTKLIAKEIIRLQMQTSFNCGVHAAIKAFNDGIEGFYPIDGSYGIELYYCDDFEIDYLETYFKTSKILNL